MEIWFQWKKPNKIDVLDQEFKTACPAFHSYPPKKKGIQDAGSIFGFGPNTLTFV